MLQVYTERVSGPGGEAVRLETLVANLLSLVTVPAPGAAPARFSLGAGDRQLVTTKYFLLNHAPTTATLSRLVT